MENIEELFLEKIKPYEDRIEKLEEIEKQKDVEIVTLKHAIQNLHRILESLKAEEKKKPAARPTTGGFSFFFN